MQIKDFIIQTEDFKRISQSFQNGKLGHAFLFVSPDEALLNEFAKAFSSLVLKDGVKVYAGTHADVFNYPSLGRKNVLVDDVENLVNNAIVKPAEGEGRVFIINVRDGISAVCQNKLLKTLEEPLRNVYILFLSSSAEILLPTIKSRVSTIYLDSLTEADFNTLGLSSQTYNLSGGNLALASKISNSEEFKQIFETVASGLEGLNKSSDVLKISRKISGLKNSGYIMQSFITIFENILTSQAKGVASSYEKIAEKFNPLSLAYIYDVICEANSKLKFNCSLVSVVDTMLLKILEEKYKWQN